jgi:hypothetical protein
MTSGGCAAVEPDHGFLHGEPTQIRRHQFSGCSGGPLQPIAASVPTHKKFAQNYRGGLMMPRPAA